MATLAFESLQAQQAPLYPSLLNQAAAGTRIGASCCGGCAQSVECPLGEQCDFEALPDSSVCCVAVTVEEQPGEGKRGCSASSEGDAGDLMFLEWITDESRLSDYRRIAMRGQGAIAGASGGEPSLRASASDRNLNGLGNSRASKRNLRRSCSMEHINCRGADGGGISGEKSGLRIFVAGSPSSVLTAGPPSPATSLDGSCGSSLASPISSPLKAKTLMAERARGHLNKHLFPSAPSAPHGCQLQGTAASPAPALLCAAPSHSDSAFFADESPQPCPPHMLRRRPLPPLPPKAATVPECSWRTLPAASSSTESPGLHIRSWRQQAAPRVTASHPLVVLDEQRQKQRAWLSLFSPSLAQSLPPLAPPAGIGAMVSAEQRANNQSTAEGKSEERAEGDSAHAGAVNPPASAPPPTFGAGSAVQAAVSMRWFADDEAADMAGDVTEAIRLGLGNVKAGCDAGSSETDHQCVTITRSGSSSNRTLVMLKPSNLRKGNAGRQVGEGQKKVRWGADEVFEIPARCCDGDLDGMMMAFQ